jgi:hypothetical protein
MRKFILTLVMIGLGATGNFLLAQTDTFVVKNAATTISVVPNDSWFYLREDYAVKIKYTSKNKMSRVELKGGTAILRDSVYILRAETGGEAVLVVYEKLKNGKEQVALSKTYKLFGRELPSVYLDNVPNDSVADQFTIIALGRLKAKTKYGNEVFRVDSFTMYFRNSTGGFDTLKSKTNQMTPEMKKRVDAIDVKKSGGMLMFENIHATSPDGKHVELPPLRIFLSTQSRIRFGL